jgi:hypothetical protein
MARHVEQTSSHIREWGPAPPTVLKNFLSNSSDPENEPMEGDEVPAPSYKVTKSKSCSVAIDVNTKLTALPAAAVTTATHVLLGEYVSLEVAAKEL